MPVIVRWQKGLYCYFVDMLKAFDTVNRNALFAKLRKYNNQGNLLQLLQCMYKELYYSFKLSDGLIGRISCIAGLNKDAF